jgi:hypothetical protein
LFHIEIIPKATWKPNKLTQSKTVISWSSADWKQATCCIVSGSTSFQDLIQTLNSTLVVAAAPVLQRKGSMGFLTTAAKLDQHSLTAIASSVRDGNKRPPCRRSTGVVLLYLERGQVSRNWVSTDILFHNQQ